MPNLIPPKIPDGEKVDFDVGDRLGLKKQSLLLCFTFLSHAAFTELTPKPLVFLLSVVILLSLI